MSRKSAFLWALMAVFVLPLKPVRAKAATARSTLKVKVNYTGAEKVDQQHKIYVLLFDANPYTAMKLVDSTSEATPPAPAAGACHILRRQSASYKKETITFNDPGVSPVYAVAFMDKSGSYDGHSDPASGSPTGVYGKAPDKAEPIRLVEGKTVKVVLAFDDSNKTP